MLYWFINFIDVLNTLSYRCKILFCIITVLQPPELLMQCYYFAYYYQRRRGKSLIAQFLLILVNIAFIDPLVTGGCLFGYCNMHIFTNAILNQLFYHFR